MELSLLADVENVLRVQAKGRIVRSEVESSDPLRAVLGSDDCSRRLVLDLSDVEYIDSSGIGWLLARHRRYREAGGDLILHSLSPTVLDMIRMLRLDAVLRLADDEISALALVRGDDT